MIAAITQSEQPTLQVADPPNQSPLHTPDGNLPSYRPKSPVERSDTLVWDHHQKFRKNYDLSGRWASMLVVMGRRGMTLKGTNHETIWKRYT